MRAGAAILWLFSSGALAGCGGPSSDAETNPAMQMGTGLFEAGTWKLRPAYFTHRLLATVLREFTAAELLADNVVKFSFASRGPVYLVWPSGT